MIKTCPGTIAAAFAKADVPSLPFLSACWAARDLQNLAEIPLFEPVRRGVDLTAAGEVFDPLEIKSLNVNGSRWPSGDCGDGLGADDIGRDLSDRG